MGRIDLTFSNVRARLYIFFSLFLFAKVGVFHAWLAVVTAATAAHLARPDDGDDLAAAML